MPVFVKRSIVSVDDVLHCLPRMALNRSRWAPNRVAHPRLYHPTEVLLDVIPFSAAARPWSSASCRMNFGTAGRFGNRLTGKDALPRLYYVGALAGSFLSSGRERVNVGQPPI